MILITRYPTGHSSASLASKVLFGVVIVFGIALFFWLAGDDDAPVPIRKTGVIIAFGDSITAGHSVEVEESYPYLLGRFLGEEVVNAGVNGATTAQGLARVQSDVIKRNPRIVVMTLMGNDILKRLPVSQSISNLKDIFTKIQEAGIYIVYIPVDPPLIGKAYNREVEALCNDMGVYYAERVLEDFWTNSRFMADRIHPNADGHRLMAKRLYEIFKLQGLMK